MLLLSEQDTPDETIRSAKRVGPPLLPLLREISNGVIHVPPGAGPDYATLCGIDGQEYPVEPCEAAEPTCWQCRATVRTVLAAAPVRILKRWARRRTGE